jgi:cytochrome b subunit of formate dehydrogenase
MTKEEITIVNEVLDPYINSTIIITDGNIAFALRNAQNNGLLNRAWIYVGVIGCAMVCVAGFAVYRKLRIPWLRICLENLGLVIMLGIYETLFFTTIVHPYQPVTGQEIERNTIEDAQQVCGLFT